jgi:hypothetical protein
MRFNLYRHSETENESPKCVVQTDFIHRPENLFCQDFLSPSIWQVYFLNFQRKKGPEDGVQNLHANTRVTMYAIKLLTAR